MNGIPKRFPAKNLSSPKLSRDLVARAWAQREDQAVSLPGGHSNSVDGAEKKPVRRAFVWCGMTVLEVASVAATLLLGALLIANQFSRRKNLDENKSADPEQRQAAGEGDGEAYQPYVEPEEPWKQELRKKLSGKVQVDFKDTPLEEALAFLNAKPEVNLILDARAVAEGAGKTAITLQVKDMDRAIALKWTLRLANLDCELRDQALFVSQKSTLEGHAELALYDVHDLKSKFPDIGSLVQDKLFPNDFIDPATSIEEKSGKLVIMQRPEVLRRIRWLIHQLRQKRKSKVLVPYMQRERSLEADREWMARITERLAKKVSCNFKGTPFLEVIEFLRQASNANMVVDGKATQGGEVPPINLNLTDVDIKTALDWAVRQAGLDYAFEGQAIFIGKPTALVEGVELRIYDVTDLLDQDAQPPLTVEDLANLVRNRLKPDSWDPAQRTAIEGQEGLLMVMQRPGVHMLIEQLLAGLRPRVKAAASSSSRP